MHKGTSIKRLYMFTAVPQQNADHTLAWICILFLKSYRNDKKLPRKVQTVLKNKSAKKHQILTLKLICTGKTVLYTVFLHIGPIFLAEYEDTGVG